MPDALRNALVDRYTIVAELGRGGMATVYQALDLKHQRTVALKVFEGEGVVAIGADRFLREIDIAAGLSHPHILPLFDSGSAGGFLYYAMPLAEGESLRTRLDREGQLPLDEVLRLTAEIADALSYAHAHNVVHRDIKPENILLHGGHALVADFGIARAIEAAGAERLTRTGVVVGTPAYMSPEQASGETRLDGRTDVYSLACVVYEMVSGEPPHTGPTPQAILARQLTEEARSLRQIRQSVSPALDATVRRALAPTPADRFQTPAEFATALARAAESTETVPPAASRRRLYRLAAGGAVLAALALLLYLNHAPDGVADRRLGVAVFPFRAAVGPATEWTERLADYVATALDGTPGLRVADPWSLWRTLRPARDAAAESPDPVEAARLAATAGVAHFVLGALALSGQHLDLTIRVYQVGLPDPIQTLTDTGSLDSLTALVQRVAVGVIGQLGLGEAPPYLPRATESADALKAFLAAREAMRRGLVDSADVAIDQAIALDSNFALALVAAVNIKSWKQFIAGEPYTGLEGLAERAVQASDSLGERERLRARAMLAMVRTEGLDAAIALKRIVQLDSTDLLAWGSLSYCHMVYGWMYGEGAAEAAEANAHVLRLDPENAPALSRGAYLVAMTADTAGMRAEVDRLRRRDTGNAMIAGSILSLRALMAPDDSAGPLLDSIARGPLPQWLQVFRTLRTYEPARAQELTGRVLASTGIGYPQRVAFGARLQLAVAQGRLREVDSTIRDPGFKGLPGFDKQVVAFLLASALAGMGDSAVTRRAVAGLAAYVPVDSALAYFESRPVWWMGWVLGAWHASFGDTAVARRWRTAFGQLPEGGTSEDYRGSLQADIDARLAIRRGDLRSAMTLEQRAYDLWSIHTNNALEALPEPAMRFQLAMLLRAANRPDSAAAILRSLVPPTTWMGFYTARASLELGELAEGRGDRAAAARHYSLAAAMWRDGGREIAVWRDRAVGGLRRVLEEPGGLLRP
ncbi:MAG: protein kinase [Gemmatimonadales bacterium]